MTINNNIPSARSTTMTIKVILYTKDKGLIEEPFSGDGFIIANVSNDITSISCDDTNDEIDVNIVDGISIDILEHVTTLQLIEKPLLIILNPESPIEDVLMDSGLYDILLTPIRTFDITTKLKQLKSIYDKRLHISQRETRIRKLADSIHEGFVLLNDTDFIYVNDYVCSLTGYSKDELLKMSFLDIIDENNHDIIKNNLISNHGHLIKNDFFTWVIRKNNEKSYLHIHDVPFLRSDGSMGRILMLRDYSHDTETVNLLQESEEKFRNLAEMTPMAIMLYQDDHWVYVNEATTHITGYAKEELYGQKFWEIVHPDFRKLVQQRGQKREADEYAEPQYEFQIVTKDGNAKWVYLSGSTTTIGGRPAGLISVIDIHERKISEEKLKKYSSEMEASNEELQAAMEELESTNEEFEAINEELISSQHDLEESETRFRNIFKNTPVGIFQTTPKGQFQSANPETVRILGYTSEEELLSLKNIALDLYYNPDDRNRFLSEIEKDKYIEGFETEFKRKNGDKIWVLINARVKKSTDGIILYYDGYLRDISSQKFAEQELKESEARFRALHNASFGGIAIHDNGMILETNQGLSDMSGFSYDELIGMNGLLLVSDNCRDMVVSNIMSGYGKRYRAEGQRKDGSLYPLEIQGKQIPYHGKEVRVTEFRDITESIKTETELKKRDQQFRDIATNVPGVIYQFYAKSDKEYGLHYVSQKVSEIFGIDNEADTFFERFIERVSPEETEYFMKSIDKAVKEKSQWEYVGRFVRPDGVLIWFKGIATPAPDSSDDETIFNGLLFDLTSEKEAISQRERLEEQLRQAQKMEAIGRLAGGIAHDFNNLLTAIIGNADLALLSITEEDLVWDNIKDISSTAERAAELTRQLLAFSRKQIIKPIIVNVSSVLSDIESMLRRVIGEDINLNFSIAENLHSIKADPTQIEQLIVNLSVNARDAMPKGGQLTVATKNIHLDSSGSKIFIDAPEGDYIELTISDSGTGIPIEIQDRVFEPFFTTKGDLGTGLGLATVYGVVKQNKGYIVIESSKGKGTTFKILLPSLIDEPESNKCYENGSDESQDNSNELILIVEDEEFVRKMAVKSLQKYGFSVIESSCGKEAIEICNKSKENIDLVLSDVVMPDMNGPDIIPHIKKCYPDIKVLFMSGYTEDSIVDQSILDPNINFIAKPFRPLELVQKIKVVLGNQE